jgi:biopolymer transport protein ExbD
MNRIKRHHAAEMESAHGIDLAPMLDFVLNLLIFFIIIAVFVKESGLMVNRPSGGTPPPNAEPSIAVQVLSSGEVWVDGRVVDPRAVSANIERLHAENSKKGVLVVADKAALSGLLVEVVDEIHLGGVYNITFATGD